MSKSLRYFLGKEQHALIHRRNSLYLFREMGEVYGDSKSDKEYTIEIDALTKRIEELKTLRNDLKSVTV